MCHQLVEAADRAQPVEPLAAERRVVQPADARRFVEWLVSRAGQEAIAGYKVNGEQLFFPNAERPEPAS